MKRIIGILMFCLGGTWIPSGLMAATHYSTPQYAKLMALDKKNGTIVVRNEVYKLRHGVRIHDKWNKFPTLSLLTVGHEIKFKTHKNKRTGQVEISEIWIQHM